MGDVGGVWNRVGEVLMGLKRPDWYRKGGC